MVTLTPELQAAMAAFQNPLTQQPISTAASHRKTLENAGAQNIIDIPAGSVAPQINWSGLDEEFMNWHDTEQSPASRGQLQQQLDAAYRAGTAIRADDWRLIGGVPQGFNPQTGKPWGVGRLLGVSDFSRRGYWESVPDPRLVGKPEGFIPPGGNITGQTLIGTQTPELLGITQAQFDSFTPDQKRKAAADKQTRDAAFANDQWIAGKKEGGFLGRLGGALSSLPLLVAPLGVLGGPGFLGAAGTVASPSSLGAAVGALGGGGLPALAQQLNPFAGPAEAAGTAAGAGATAAGTALPAAGVAAPVTGVSTAALGTGAGLAGGAALGAGTALGGGAAGLGATTLGAGTALGGAAGVGATGLTAGTGLTAAAAGGAGAGLLGGIGNFLGTAAPIAGGIGALAGGIGSLVSGGLALGGSTPKATGATIGSLTTPSFGAEFGSFPSLTRIGGEDPAAIEQAQRARLGEVGAGFERLQGQIPGLQQQLLDQPFGDITAGTERLRQQVAATREELGGQFNKVREARLQELGNVRDRTIGNLRDTLRQRRVFGAGFASADIERAELGFAQEQDRVLAESAIQEAAIRGDFDRLAGQLLQVDQQTLLQQTQNIAAQAGLNEQEASLLSQRMATIQAEQASLNQTITREFNELAITGNLANKVQALVADVAAFNAAQELKVSVGKGEAIEQITAGLGSIFG